MEALKRFLACYAKWAPCFSDRAQSLIKAKHFPLDTEKHEAFNTLKQLLMKAALHCPDNTKLIAIDYDGSDVALSVTLSQSERPVTFMSRTLKQCRINFSVIEKEATEEIEAVRKLPQHFTIVTDQRSVAFMMDNR